MKKVLTSLLAAAMIITAVPAVSAPVYAGTAFDIADGDIVIENDTVGSCKVTQNSAITKGLTSITVIGTTTKYAITVKSGADANIVINNLYINRSDTNPACAFLLEGGSSVALTVSGDNKLKSGAGMAGLQVPGQDTGVSKAAVTIDGTGTLNAYGGAGVSGTSGSGAGIGGYADSDGSVGSITINGGTINAYGGAGTDYNGGAGIGCGSSGKNATVSINGGTITAVGGNGDSGYRSGGAGIGGADSSISISGGAITATGGDGYAGGPGIGGSGSISIIGGTVDAAGGTGGSESGPGIGGTGSTTASNCTVTIGKNATIAAFSRTTTALSTGMNAIRTGSGSLESGSTGYVIMVKFWNLFGAGNPVEIRNSAGSAVNSTTTRTKYCNSVALSVPSAGTYSLYADSGYEKGYWKHSTTTTGSTAYNITTAGIRTFDEVLFYGDSLPVSGVSTTSGTESYIISNSAVTVDSGVTVNSFDSGISEAAVMIRNFVDGDYLEYPATVGNITGSYNSDTGVLTLSGSDTQANYQSAFRSVGFYTISDDTTARIIDFSVGSSLYCSDTGHFYEYVPVSGNITWGAAETAAEALSLYGIEGYLITITSSAESAFIKTKVTGTGWIGAKDINTDTSIADWRWVTGPEGLEDSGNGLAFWYGTTSSGALTGSAVSSMFTNWTSGEPNNSSNNETVGQMYADGSNLGQWNDLPETNTIAGYFVEYGGMSGDSTVHLSASKTIKVYAASGSGGSSGGSSSHSSSSSDDGAPVIVNGTSYTAGVASSFTEDGRSGTSVTVDTAKLNTILNSQDENPSVIVPVTSGAKIASGILTGQMISDMEGREATLSLKTNSVAYTLPASEIDIDAVSQELGEDLDLSDITVDIRISESDDATATVAASAAENGGFEIMIPAMDFNITCTYGEKTVAAEVFNVYVQRTVLIPDGVDPEKITTGVVVRPDGTSYHVPTEVKEIDGAYYAVINSLTNSTYTVVWHPIEFTDVASHWSKDAVNDMGSRMVISGVGSNLFEPNRDITRAEFAAIVVRALGLDGGMGDNSFTDVGDSDWFSGYIETAVGYGIINGFGDGTFRPDSSITREQAMTMIARAMKITGLEPELSDTEAANLLAGYGDSGDITNYARDTIAACLETGVVLGRDNGTIAPGNYITRAEVAVIAQRLLQKSELI